MLKKCTITLLLSTLLIPIFAQVTSNFELENWVKKKNYEDPDNGWATANPIRDIFATNPVTTFKTTDKYSGTFAARLRTDKLATLVVAGVLATGTFDNDAEFGENLLLGQPYTKRPEVFSGYYKYTSVEKDSAEIFLALIKWNKQTSSRDTIATASHREYNTIKEYTEFKLPLEYISDETPDSIIIVFVSSGGGQNYEGQVGSELFIDEISLSEPNGVKVLMSNEIDVSVFPNPSNGLININLTENPDQYKLTIYNAEGKQVLSSPLESKNNSFETKGWNSGDYYISIFDNKGLIASKKLSIIK